MYYIGDVEINDYEWNVSKFSGHKYTSEQLLFHTRYSAKNKTFTKEDIDFEMQFHKNVSLIQVSGLNQESFDHLIDKYGYQFKSIYFFGCQNVKDLSALSKLQKIEYILFYWLRQSDKLWDMSNNHNLKGIQISGAKRIMLNLGLMASAPNLEEIRLNGGTEENHNIQDLNIFTECKNLKRLSLQGLTLTHDDIAPLTKIPKLEILDFEPSFLETEQIAFLVAKLPQVTGISMCAYNDYTTKDVRICGKRKPSLCIPSQQGLLEKYIKEFEDLVRKYAS